MIDTNINNVINNLITTQLSGYIINDNVYRDNILNNPEKFNSTIAFIDSAIEHYVTKENFYNCSKLLEFKKLIEQKVSENTCKN